MTENLLLWDIDGTLITTGQASETAIGQATEYAFGIKSDLSKVDFHGRTDTWVGIELLKQLNLAATPEHIHRFHEAYLDCLKKQLPLHPGKVLPGIVAILEQAAKRRDCVNALLTGNLERGAKLKLSHYSIWHYFEFGAFADDSHIRNELGPVALKRALARTGHDFSPDRVYVIGDTPHDITCGKIIGAKTISVATGNYTKAELLACEPYACFDDFSHPEKFFELLRP
ncbi:MAG: haloacid dehalogenase-like hydrolase [Verrucomicrobiales bacterium]|jgi:phosphoglycolate phosphatase-like HAD superfamily hydrolase|nr:haloacid dehalogenase-like hydrolase [Verrucomicrobiales bacterium]